MVGTVLAVPLVAYELHQLWVQPEFYFYTVGQLTNAAKASLRWTGYAFLYGYFYPWVRGGHAVDEGVLAPVGPLAGGDPAVC
jgi:hypothetical protein